MPPIVKKIRLSTLLFVSIIAVLPANAQPSILLTAVDFAVLGGSTVTNTGATSIIGNLGVYPGSAITGLGTITLTGAIHANNAIAQQAQFDNFTAYNGLANMPFDTDLTGQDLGGKTLTSGVYRFDSSAQLTGTLKLDAQGFNNAYWVFQMGSTLTTASASAVQIINAGSNGGSDNGLFWQVGSSATLGTSTSFEGNILAKASITLNTASTLHNGRLLAQTGAVTLDTNTVSIFSPPPDNGTLSGGLKYTLAGNIVPIGPSRGGTAVTPELPGLALVVPALLPVALMAMRRRRSKATA